MKNLLSTLLGLAALAGSTYHAQGQTIHKLVDFNQVLDGVLGNLLGENYPSGRFALIGTNLWFTTQLGGTLGTGDIAIYNPVEGTQTSVATLATSGPGKTPWGSLTLANGLAWFTTSVGAAGNKGAIVSIDPSTYALTTYPLPADGSLGSGSRSTPLQISSNLWFLTLSGGAFNKGTMDYLNLSNGVVSKFLDFDGTNGAQPFGSIVPIGTNYYFTTFTGGTNSATGFPNGAGTLQKLSFSNSIPYVTKLINLTTGYTAFPGGEPVLVGSNTLYFTTDGNATQPGSIIKYDINTGKWTNLFNFVTNAVALAAYGKQPQYEGAPVLYNNQLYMTTFTGGTSNKGTIITFSLSNNTVTKLADLEGSGGLALGGSPYNSGLLYQDPVTGRNRIYFPISRGGVNGGATGFGTILSLSLPPPPISTSLTNNGSGLTLSWTGGYSPYNVDLSSDLSTPSWTTNWLSNLTNSSVDLSPRGGASFYRVSGASQ